MNLFHDDGANYQAQCVLACLRPDASELQYDFKIPHDIDVYRWSNCREQGYVIVLKVPSDNIQLNIAFFEHRNSDSIAAVAWDQNTINPPNIDSMDTGGKIYKDKWDVSKSVPYGQFKEMAQWIIDQLSERLKSINS